MPSFFASFLFENPIRLAALGCAAQFLLICLWSWRRSRGTARAVKWGFLVIVSLLAASLVVITDHEHVASECRLLAGFVERGDLPSVAERLAASFKAGDWDRTEFLDHVRQALHDYRFDHVRLSGIAFDDRSAADVIGVEFDAVCGVRSATVDVDRVRTRWRLRFRGDFGAWRVETIDPVPTPLSPIRSWRDGVR